MGGGEGRKNGKDFVTAFIILTFFLTRHPCRILTTSAKDDHLRVLWGEIGRFIQTSAIPLDVTQGGPLIVRQRELRKVYAGEECKLSYVVGMVASEDRIAAMAGHHIAQTGDGIPRTLFVADEASSVPDSYYGMCTTWANRVLVIGNPWDCSNFFRHAIKGKPGTTDRGGDIPYPNVPDRFMRKIIKIRAEDSPNVQRALLQQAAGLEPDDKMVIPGVLPYHDYAKRRSLWDKVRQCVSLDAEFYEGAENLLFPPEWLNRAELLADKLKKIQRRAKGIGIDPAEGGNKTAMTAVDEFGVIEQVSKKTPNTAVIIGEAMAFMRKHHCEPHRVFFDRGGGGKQLADLIRSDGIPVQTVAFGEAPSLDIKSMRHTLKDRRSIKEDRYVYVKMRDEMYGELSLLLDPEGEDNERGFAIPREYDELRRQLALFPKRYDREGRLKLPPKNKVNKDSTEECLVDIIGHSPDEADSLAIACHAMRHKPPISRAGAVGAA